MGADSRDWHSESGPLIKRVRSGQGALQWGLSLREVGRGAELKGRRGNSVLRTWVWGAKNSEYWREAGEEIRGWQGGPGASTSGELWVWLRPRPLLRGLAVSPLASVQDRGCSGAPPSPSWSCHPQDFPHADVVKPWCRSWRCQVPGSCLQLLSMMPRGEVLSVVQAVDSSMLPGRPGHQGFNSCFRSLLGLGTH